jgi:hypothetical protein
MRATPTRMAVGRREYHAGLEVLGRCHLTGDVVAADGLARGGVGETELVVARADAAAAGVALRSFDCVWSLPRTGFRNSCCSPAVLEPPPPS